MSITHSRRLVPQAESGPQAEQYDGPLIGRRAKSPGNPVQYVCSEIIRLSVEDQRLLAEALLNPPEPAPALVRAAERHRRVVQKIGDRRLPL
jgi:hypothetical protein